MSNDGLRCDLSPRDRSGIRGPEDSVDVNSTMNRRHFLECIAGVGAAASLGQSVFGRSLHDDATGDSRLPDGTVYAPWEQPLTFSKTYYVDNGDANADDNGPGTQARPSRTINQAAGLLQPGERVVI